MLRTTGRPASPAVHLESFNAQLNIGQAMLVFKAQSTPFLSHKLEDSITLTASQPRAVAVVRAQGVGVGMRTSFQHAKFFEQSAPELIVFGQGRVSSLIPSRISFPSSNRMLGPATRRTRSF